MTTSNETTITHLIDNYNIESRRAMARGSDEMISLWRKFQDDLITAHGGVAKNDRYDDVFETLKNAITTFVDDDNWPWRV